MRNMCNVRNAHKGLKIFCIKLLYAENACIVEDVIKYQAKISILTLFLSSFRHLATIHCSMFHLYFGINVHVENLKIVETEDYW